MCSAVSPYCLSWRSVSLLLPRQRSLFVYIIASLLVSCLTPITPCFDCILGFLAAVTKPRIDFSTAVSQHSLCGLFPLVKTSPRLTPHTHWPWLHQTFLALFLPHDFLTVWRACLSMSRFITVFRSLNRSQALKQLSQVRKWLKWPLNSLWRTGSLYFCLAFKDNVAVAMRNLKSAVMRTCERLCVTHDLVDFSRSICHCDICAVPL